MTIIANENFSINDKRTPDWKRKILEDSDGETMSIFIDVTSGLVVYDGMNMKADSLEGNHLKELIGYGVWKNETQEVGKISRLARAYARKKLNVIRSY